MAKDLSHSLDSVGGTGEGVNQWNQEGKRVEGNGNIVEIEGISFELGQIVSFGGEPGHLKSVEEDKDGETIITLDGVFGTIQTKVFQRMEKGVGFVLKPTGKISTGIYGEHTKITLNGVK